VALRDVEEAPKCFANDLADARVVVSRSILYGLLQFGIESHWDDLGRCATEHGPSASSALEVLYVVAALGFVGECLDVGVGEDAARLRCVGA